MKRLSGKAVKVGIIGCGNISSIYCKNLKTFKTTELVAVADLELERAQSRAQEFGIPKACSVKELLADPEIGIVVNLTVPKAHAQVALSAIKAGKSVYGEKPLAISKADGAKILAEAKKRGVLVGCAPDTFLGAGIQTCRKLLDDGWIGEAIAATAVMMCHGHESWHPSPEFYYEVGGGPMFDMGPYYLTALISMMGPVKRTCGSARITFPERTITSEPKKGKKVKVETPTHISGTMDFANGAVGTILTSFDVWSHSLPCIEIYGSAGSLRVPDPNCFGGPVLVKRANAKDWAEVPLTHSYADNSRGLGVADMAASLLSGRPHRANGEMAGHVLDVMHSFLDSSKQGRYVQIKSTCKRPALLPMGLTGGRID